MSNEELRIKIAGILQSRSFKDMYLNLGIGLITALDIADALIAAGIGDIQDIREKANLDISGATSNPTQYTEAPADPQEPKIKKWYRNTVGHEPANYDAAALKAYIAHLEAENAALHERLSKAVELPCKVGDTVYEIIDGEIRETEVIQLEIDNMGLWITIRMGFGVSTVLFNKVARIYLTREAAETRLKELQGEKK